MIVPDIFSFSGYREFLRSFLDANAEERGFSHRALAKRLSWPHALLSDIVGGRRELSVTKAAELAEVLGLSELATERFLLFSMQESKATAVKNLAARMLDRRVDTTNPIEGPDLSDYGIGASALALHILIATAKRYIAPTEVLRLLSTFADLTEAEVIRLYGVFERGNVFRFDARGRLELFEPHLTSNFTHPEESTDMWTRRLHTEFAKSMMKHLEVHRRPRTLYSGVLPLPIASFEDVAREVAAFRNWMTKFSDAAAEDPAHKGDLGIFQFDLNLFPLMQETF